jgi:hypothetical protein
MRNDSHHECERHRIAERGARRRRFARFEVVLKNIVRAASAAVDLIRLRICVPPMNRSEAAPLAASTSMAPSDFRPAA